MIQRIGGWAILIFWCGAMGWLGWHDLWPVWTAKTPPALTSASLAPGNTNLQTGIFDAHGFRRGTIWTRYSVVGGIVSRDELLALDEFSPLPRLRIEFDLHYAEDGFLDDFGMKVRGAEVPIELRGERFASQMAFELTAGPIRQTFKISMADAAMISGSMNPFPNMPELHVGQTWRMSVIDPLAILTGRASRFTSSLARVTETATLTTDRGPVECFVVEAPGARAWVGHDGAVVQQEVELPIFGKITLRDEPYDATAREAARRRNIPPRER